MHKIKKEPAFEQGQIKAVQVFRRERAMRRFVK